MDFPNAQVKSVKADLAKQKITISFEVDLSEQDAASQLARYADGDEGLGAVDLRVNPRQLPLHD